MLAQMDYDKLAAMDNHQDHTLDLNHRITLSKVLTLDLNFGVPCDLNVARGIELARSQLAPGPRID